MNRGKYASPRRRRRRSTLKPLLVAMAVVLLIGCVAGGTLAWLTDTTNNVVNTFTTSDINITLTESDTTDNKAYFKMIPGYTINKDPEVTVKADSEDCWLFVKIEESASLADYIDYVVDAGWTPLKDGEVVVPGIYYRKVTNITEDKKFGVIGYNIKDANGIVTSFVPDKVLVKDTVTKTMMNNITLGKVVVPTLTFKAYAIQLYKSNGVEFPVADAYDQVKTLDAPTGSTN